VCARDSAWRQLPSAGRLRNYLAATVPDWDYELPAEDRLQMMTVATLRSAFKAAQISTDDARAFVVIGTSYADLLDRTPDDSYTLKAWRDNLVQALGLRRQPIVVSTACSSGSDAIGLGLMMVRSGEVEICVCGGVDILTDTKRAGHSALGTLSATTLRAFSPHHDGTLLGEGAAFLVLQRSDGLKSDPLGFLLGQGAANDASAMTAPDSEGSGARLAIERALANAGMRPGDVSAYCAHGSGTVLNDVNEVAAIRAVFGDGPTPQVFATKPNFGHSLGATGAIEALALLLALRKRIVPPLAGTQEVIGELSRSVSTSEPVAISTAVGASVTLGFGGYDTCLILGGPSCVPLAKSSTGDLKPGCLISFCEVARSECSESAQQRLSPGLRHKIAFADPAAWIVAGAVESLVGFVPKLNRDRAAIILIDSFGPVDTLAELRSGRTKGRVSPMRFAAAIPSAILAVSCIALGLRGPALTLTGEVPNSVEASVIAASTWLQDGVADVVILVTRDTPSSARCIALGLPTVGCRPVELLDLASWLTVA